MYYTAALSGLILYSDASHFIRYTTHIKINNNNRKKTRIQH